MRYKKITLLLSLLLFSCLQMVGQSERLKIKKKKFHTSNNTVIDGEIGYLSVPENRNNPKSRNIKIKFIRLKSISENPKEPIIYLEGGGATCTWQAEKPEYLNDWLPILKVSDLIFVDQRGTADNKLTYLQKNAPIEDFFVSAETADKHYQNLCNEALQSFQRKGIDVMGYTVVEHAKDIDKLTRTLGIDQYSIFGFSYGTHIGMALMKLFVHSIVNAVLISSDGLDQSFNYPSYLDKQVQKISEMVRQDKTMNKIIPDLTVLLKKVMTKLDKEPVIVSVKHPITKKPMSVKIGSFGLSVILRLDIDDTNDIKIIPRLLYSIDQREYTILEWFVQKRIALSIGISGNGLNQGIASWASEERWKKIRKEAKESSFGNVVNFPFYEASKVWPRSNLEVNTLSPIKSSIRTLFITGDLDCRTPVHQVNKISQGFSNSTHLIVKNAGHEQAMWNLTIFDEAIPQFLMGNNVSNMNAANKEIKFIELTGVSNLHPSIKKNN